MPILVHFSSLIPKILIFSCHLWFDHFQFILIHGPNIPDSYAILFFTASDFMSITSHIHSWIHCFHYGLASSFFLELFLHSCPVAYWAPTDLKSYSLSILSFCLFILFMGFSKQEYWSAIPFSSGPHCVRPLHHACPSWVAPHGMA